MVMDLPLGLLPVHGGERGESIEALVYYDAYTPPVTSPVVRFSSDDFWGHILAGANDATGKSAPLVIVTPV